MSSKVFIEARTLFVRVILLSLGGSTIHHGYLCRCGKCESVFGQGWIASKKASCELAACQPSSLVFRGFSPSGVSSLWMSNHSFLNSIRHSYPIAGLLDVIQEYREFIASQPRNRVALSHQVTQLVRHGLQAHEVAAR
jgi:hypothetical protein